MDLYKIAVEYLMNKYGRIRINPTREFQIWLDCIHQKEIRERLLREATDKDYICSYIDIVPRNGDFDHQVILLLAEHNYNPESKKELENLLKSRDLM